jgi:hypothetical protein
MEVTVRGQVWNCVAEFRSIPPDDPTLAMDKIRRATRRTEFALQRPTPLHTRRCKDCGRLAQRESVPFTRERS